jgi:2-amino-4-hydroxy-6-hydroxymethyldihydropteridine diphosphokinase
MARAFVGLGSNLGDRLANLQAAVQLLGERGVRVVASSRVWQTDPLGGPRDQPEFLNAVVCVDLPPADDGELSAAARRLLAAANGVESDLGRVRTERWGPRTIDIDVLLVDGWQGDDPHLTIPHPRMLERAFVMLPLLEVEPDPLLPDGRRAVEVATVVGEARPFAPPLEVTRA